MSSMFSNPSRTSCNRGYVTGNRSVDRQPHDRLEIDEFCQDWRSLNLLLLALRFLQQNDKANLRSDWSFWGLGKIHGSPYVPSFNVPRTELYDLLRYLGDGERTEGVREGLPTAGYCPHGSVTFLPWHRVYSAAFEQSLQATMVEIALLYNDPGERNEQLRRAVPFRLPYWNPFQGRTLDPAGHLVNGISLLFCVPRIRVSFPNTIGGNTTTIDNPLYSYTFPTAAEFTTAELDAAHLSEELAKAYAAFLTPPSPPVPGPRTWRCNATPGVSDHAFLQSQLPYYSQAHEWTFRTWTDRSANVTEAQLAENFNSAVEPYKEVGMKVKLYACLTDTYGQLSFPHFATRAYFATQKIAQRIDARSSLQAEPRSCESFHDNIHGIFGIRGGTMPLPNFAGFDPVFHFWHSFVDFIFALYQVANPNDNGGWWRASDNMFNTEATWVTRWTKEMPHDPLTPFYIDRSEDHPDSPRPPLGQNGQALGYPFWNSNDVRDHTVLGYDHAPLREIRRSPPGAQRIAAANTYINSQFAWFQPLSVNQQEGDYTNPNAQTAIMTMRQRGMRGLRAFVKNPTGMAGWPPLIDAGDVPLDIYNPANPLQPPPLVPLPSPISPSVVEPAPVVGPPVVPSLGPGPPASGQTSSVTEMSHKAVGPQREHFPARAAKSDGKSSSGQVGEVGEQTGIKAKAVEDAAEKIGGGTSDPNKLHYNLPPHILNEEGELRNWSFQFKVQRHALNTSFSVYVFIGDFPPNPTEWAQAVNLIMPAHCFVFHNHDRVAPYSGRGDNPSHPAPANPSAPGCANCHRQAEEGLVVADWVPLTHFLMGYVLSGRKASDLVPEAEARLASLEQEDVVPFLKRHLHWRVLRTADNTEIHRDDVAGLKCWVHDEIMILPKRMDQLATYREHALQWEITDGRPSGLNHGEHPRHAT